MSVGERGGVTRTLDAGIGLLEDHKAHWLALISQRIDDVLCQKGTFHADDLVPLGIPAEHKNCVGGCVIGKIRKGLMEETGERRASTDPAGHGRRSAVYRSTASREGASATSRAVASLSAHADPESERERGAPPESTKVSPAGKTSVAHPGDREQVTASPEPSLPSSGSGELLLFDLPSDRYRDAA